MTTVAPDEFDPFGPLEPPMAPAAGAPLPPAGVSREMPPVASAPRVTAPGAAGVASAAVGAVEPVEGAVAAPAAPAAPDQVAAEVRLADGDVTAPLGGVIAGGSRKPFPAAKPLPAGPGTEAQDVRDAVGAEPDYSDLASINRDLLRLRVRMAQVRRAMREASRAGVEARITYQRELRRALVQQSGGSAEMRKAAAELMCEDLEARAIIAEKAAEELVTLYRSVRDDMENAKVVAYNLRVLHSLD